MSATSQRRSCVLRCSCVVWRGRATVYRRSSHRIMTTPRRILIMTAHPDDADIMAGGTVARWIDEGHEIHSVMFTRGDKGHDDPGMTPERVAAMRRHCGAWSRPTISGVQHVAVDGQGFEAVTATAADRSLRCTAMRRADGNRDPQATQSSRALRIVRGLVSTACIALIESR